MCTYQASFISTDSARQGSGSGFDSSNFGPGENTGPPFTHQLRLVDPTGMARAVERGDDPALLIQHRYRQGDDTIGELVFDRGVAGFAALLDQHAKLGGIRYRSIREGCKLRRRE